MQGSAIPYDEELERAINAHGQGGAVSQLQTGSTEEYEEEVLEGDEANLKALNEDSVGSQEALTISDNYAPQGDYNQDVLRGKLFWAPLLGQFMSVYLEGNSLGAITP